MLARKPQTIDILCEHSVVGIQESISSLPTSM